MLMVVVACRLPGHRQPSMAMLRKAWAGKGDGAMAVAGECPAFHLPPGPDRGGDCSLIVIKGGVASPLSSFLPSRQAGSAQCGVVAAVRGAETPLFLPLMDLDLHVACRKRGACKRHNGYWLGWNNSWAKVFTLPQTMIMILSGFTTVSVESEVSLLCFIIIIVSLLLLL